MTAYEMRISDCSADLCSSVLVEIADDNGEKVVEIVRQPAGDLADRFHLLRLDELLLERLVVGDIGIDGADRRDVSGGVANGELRAQDVSGIPVFTGEGQVEELARARSHDAAGGLVRRRPALARKGKGVDGPADEGPGLDVENGGGS